jgi:Glycosyl transferase family 11
MGGLGNQLFQIFTTIAYAMKHRQKFVFLQTDMLGNRKTYWKTFLKNLLHFTSVKMPKSPNIIKEKEFAFNQLPAPVSENTFLNGYFQSYLYFNEYSEVICRFIKLEEHKNKVRDLVSIDYDNTISMHFRLGDYKKLQGHHPVLSQSYYMNALSEALGSKDTTSTVLYFCEKEDNAEVDEIVCMLSQTFQNVRFLKADDKYDDWVQMLLMSLCRQNIIANSTFSWWGAYFNSHPNKKVYYPKVWFGPFLANHNTQDLCMKEWTQVRS